MRSRRTCTKIAPVARNHYYYSTPGNLELRRTFVVPGSSCTCYSCLKTNSSGRASAACSDYPGWKDSNDNDCDEGYENSDGTPDCDATDKQYAVNYGGRQVWAKEACCICGGGTCDEDEFTCKNGDCEDNTDVGDGNDDCGDNSDEREPSLRT